MSFYTKISITYFYNTVMQFNLGKNIWHHYDFAKFSQATFPPYKWQGTLLVVDPYVLAPFKISD